MTQTLPIEARKLPRQRRAKETVETILTATARVLAQDGYAAASTNRIAAVAGVSIGSIYQYFPNKDALVLAVAEDHSLAMIHLLEEGARAAVGGSVATAVRHVVHGMIAAHAIDPALHRALVEQVLHLGMDVLRETQDRVRGLVEALLVLRADEVGARNVPVTAFLLVATVEGVIHTALFERPALLADPAFEDELCLLVLRYLGIAEPGERPTQVG